MFTLGTDNLLDIRNIERFARSMQRANMYAHMQARAIDARQNTGIRPTEVIRRLGAQGMRDGESISASGSLCGLVGLLMS